MLRSVQAKLLKRRNREEPTGHGRASGWSPRLFDLGSRFGVVAVWALIVLGFSILSPRDFPTVGTFRTIFGTQSVLLILTLGTLIPLTCGLFDASVSGVLSLSLVLVGYLNVNHGVPVGIACAVALAAGVLVGFVNVFFTIVIGVDSLIVTLGTGTLVTGIGQGFLQTSVAPISQSLVNVFSTNLLLGLPAAFYFGLALTILLWYVYSYTPLGRYLYFVGAGPDVARLAGLRVDRLRAGSLMASAVISAIAGIALAGLNGSSDPNVGTSFLLPAFAAAFLGSTVFFPGRFNPWGAFVAVYFLVTGITGLELQGVAAWIEPVFYGASLVLAVAASKVAARRTVS